MNTSVGITQGDNSGNYNPRTGVTRAQMAGFIARTLSQLYDEDRIYSLLELLTERFEAGSTDEQARPATENSDGSAADDRTYTATGLAQDATGGPEADIISVNGEAPRNNMGVGTDTTENDEDMSASVVTEADEDGTITFTVDGVVTESIVPVLYVNGGAGRGPEKGGDSPRVEIDDQGRPLEYFGLGGVTNFVAAAGDGEEEDAPIIVEARVATGSGMATEGAMATDGAGATASAGDFFELRFNEPVSTDTADVEFTVTDEDGDEAVIQCGAEVVEDGVGIPPLRVRRHAGRRRPHGHHRSGHLHLRRADPGHSVFLADGELERARELAERAVSLRPDVEALLILAAAQEQLQQPAAARAAYEAVLALDSDNDQATERIAMLADPR